MGLFFIVFECRGWDRSCFILGSRTKKVGRDIDTWASSVYFFSFFFSSSFSSYSLHSIKTHATYLAPLHSVRHATTCIPQRTLRTAPLSPPPRPQMARLDLASGLRPHAHRWRGWASPAASILHPHASRRWPPCRLRAHRWGGAILSLPMFGFEASHDRSSLERNILHRCMVSLPLQ